MAFDNKAILFSSIVGSKVAESLPRFALVQNELAKVVLPPIPFIPLKGKEEIHQGEEISNFINWKANAPAVENQFFPLSFRKVGSNDPWYTFPYEPLINISGSNNIVKRTPAKNGNSDITGSVKESWAQEDFSITITGSLIGVEMRGGPQETFPRADFQKLIEYIAAPEGIEVLCEPLQLLGINYLVIEDYSFPFTKGENVQAYELKCLSDNTINFLLEIPN